MKRRKANADTYDTESKRIKVSGLAKLSDQQIQALKVKCGKSIKIFKI